MSGISMSEKKKSRCTNFSKEEELVLLEKVYREKDIIECKITNKISNREKDQSWIRICDDYNSTSNQLRHVDQLKSKYDNLKTKARKVISAHKLNYKGTGGGPCINTNDPIVEAILKIINIKTVTGMESTLDCDKDEDFTNFVKKPFSPLNIMPDHSLVNGNAGGEPVLLISPSSESENKENTIQIESPKPSTSHLSITSINTKIPNKKSLKRNINSEWSDYVPSKLKEPVSKKLRLSVPNPVVNAKAKYFEAKREFYLMQTKINNAKEGREEEKHRKEMCLLDLQILQERRKLAVDNIIMEDDRIEIVEVNSEELEEND